MRNSRRPVEKALCLARDERARGGRATDACCYTKQEITLGRKEENKTPLIYYYLSRTTDEFWKFFL